MEEVCDLLRVHINANVLLESPAGRVELLAHDSDTDAKISHGASAILILPITAAETEIGKLTLSRNTPFTPEEALAADIALAVCAVLVRHRESQLSADKKRRAGAVRAIINSLSFSELEAATHMVKALEKGEGLLIAGHIADKLGFTRSVVTGALKKLEGANLIETRSLGMKGTYIRVKDELLIEELRKL